MIKWLGVAWILLLIVLHQDSWNWKDKTLIFNFLPIGLAYHAGFTILSAVTLWVFTRLFWPTHLDALENEHPAGAKDGHS
jgi:hypothetical protein